ncbi:hypothetical protein LTR62_006978 [Meristemomyces frigidus]|uniref:General alpha-glucoside permease n=1 Tax=Meristemomyces frigidus TaxID=1508187 RepID=A0AAN7TFK3_9PEZI|nr:hypothetical protein LTR62_006978 [Meristemomyces frigidus]
MPPPTSGSASWVGLPRIKGATESMQMALLTTSMIGLDFCWGTEMTYATPYLLSLGLSKSRLSLVWIAGPLSGLVMQPVVGMVSDKRREGTRRKAAIAVAVVDIYVLDFVINIAQSTCRALVVDALPIEKQQLGSAWVSRMSGVGKLMMYGLGALDLKAWTGNFMGDSQFKKVCLIAAVAMAAAQGTTCWAVSERVYVATGKSGGSESTIQILRQIFTTTLRAPERINAICMVQFWSWIGWFPFLFYGSTWVGEIYLRHEAPNATGDALTNVGRIGSTAFIMFAIICFAASIVLPWLVQSPEEDGYTPRPPKQLGTVLSSLRSRKPTLLTAWMLSNLVFAASMIFAPFVRSVGFATVIIALCGISFAVGGWAPGTFLGIEVNKMSSTLPSMNGVNGGLLSGRQSEESIEMITPPSRSPHSSQRSSPRTLHLRHASNASIPDNDSTGELSGIYLGILNIYTTLPQFVGTAISWVVFSILEPGKSPELATEAPPEEHHGTAGVSGIAVCLFIGAISALVAAWATRRLSGGG